MKTWLVLIGWTNGLAWRAVRCDEDDNRRDPYMHGYVYVFLMQLDLDEIGDD